MLSNCLQDLSRPLNLLQERNILTVGSSEILYPNLPHDYKKINCNPESVQLIFNVIFSHFSSLLIEPSLPLLIFDWRI